MTTLLNAIVTCVAGDGAPYVKMQFKDLADAQRFHASLTTIAKPVADIDESGMHERDGCSCTDAELVSVAPVERDAPQAQATWRVSVWGNGTTPDGYANIFCDAHEALIAEEIEISKAEWIVECHNDALTRPSTTVVQKTQPNGNSTTEAKPKTADAAMFTDYLGCEIVSTDVARIELAAAEATNGPMPVTYYRVAQINTEAKPEALGEVRKRLQWIVDARWSDDADIDDLCTYAEQALSFLDNKEQRK